MNREEFTALPPSMALSILLDILPSGMVAKIEGIEKPKVPFPPKYDMRVWRKSGFQWASEMDLESLTWFRDRSLKSAESGGQYAEKDRGTADKLERFTKYRAVFPSSAINLTRGDDDVTAATPSGKAKVWTPLPKGDDNRTDSGSDYSGNDSGGGDDDSDIPF